MYIFKSYTLVWEKCGCNYIRFCLKVGRGRLCLVPDQSVRPKCANIKTRPRLWGAETKSKPRPFIYIDTVYCGLDKSRSKIPSLLCLRPRQDWVKTLLILRWDWDFSKNGLETRPILRTTMPKILMVVLYLLIITCYHCYNSCDPKYPLSRRCFVLSCYFAHTRSTSN